jgi:hypothetical protein
VTIPGKIEQDYRTEPWVSGRSDPSLSVVMKKTSPGKNNYGGGENSSVDGKHISDFMGKQWRPHLIASLLLS